MHYVILGLIQGLTEFLPVSSSGHLVIVQYFLNLEIPGVAFETFLHFGTLLAVIFLFRHDIKTIINYFGKSLKKLYNRDIFLEYIKKNPQSKFGWFLLISTIPGAMIGYFFNSTFEKLFGNPSITSLMLVITGICIFFTDKYLIKGSKNIKDITITDAIYIGFAQAFAIIPGISRSGFTIMMALGRNFDREFAAKYSFILSVPIIMGATIFEIEKIIYLNISLKLLFFSGLTAFLSGYWAMQFFIKMLVKFKLRIFSYYLWIVGITVLYISLTSLNR
jgi:undecaprenyl-diphosphatase